MRVVVQSLSRSELLALPVLIDLETAGQAFGLGRTTSYALVRAGQFPVPVLRFGRGYRVRAADVLALLGVSGG